MEKPKPGKTKVLPQLQTFAGCLPFALQLREVARGKRAVRFRAEDGGALLEPVAVGGEGALRDRVQRYSERGKYQKLIFPKEQVIKNPR